MTLSSWLSKHHRRLPLRRSLYRAALSAALCTAIATGSSAQSLFGYITPFGPAVPTSHEECKELGARFDEIIRNMQAEASEIADEAWEVARSGPSSLALPIYAQADALRRQASDVAYRRSQAVSACRARVAAYERESVAAERREAELEVADRARRGDFLASQERLSVRSENPLRGAGLSATLDTSKKIVAGTLGKRGLDDFPIITSRMPEASTAAGILGRGAKIHSRVNMFSGMFADDPLTRLQSSSLLANEILADAGVTNPVAQILTHAAIMTIINLARDSVAEFEGAVEAFDSTEMATLMEQRMLTQREVGREITEKISLLQPKPLSLGEQLAALSASAEQTIALRSQDATNEMRKVAEARERARQARERERLARERARERALAERRAQERQQAAARAEQAARNTQTSRTFTYSEPSGPDTDALVGAILGVVDAYARTRSMTGGGAAQGTAGYGCPAEFRRELGRC